HHVVVMLTGVDEDLTDRGCLAKRRHQRRNLHVVGSSPDDVCDRLHRKTTIRWCCGCDSHPGVSCTGRTTGNRPGAFSSDTRRAHAGDGSEMPMPRNPGYTGSNKRVACGGPTPL